MNPPAISRTFTCAICLDKQEDALHTLVCGHIFHRDCIFDYQSCNPDAACPICRAPIAETAPLLPPEIAARQSALRHSLLRYVAMLIFSVALFIAACIFAAFVVRM
ncbi:hypothetical protein BX667DRAFT_493346, partial [Coemansia mojavensis]